MIVTADDVGRFLRGAAHLLHRRREGIAAFDVTEAGFWRSFGAIWLTLPAYVVTLGLERSRLQAPPGTSLVADPGAAALLGLAHVGAFLLLPLLMIPVCRRLGLGAAYVPYIVVTNWLSALAALVLAVPGLLVLVGWAPPGLGTIFFAAFGIVLVHMQWFATKASLGVTGGLAAALVGFHVLAEGGLWFAAALATGP
jgi:hypothetical protein